MATTTWGKPKQQNYHNDAVLRDEGEEDNYDDDIIRQQQEATVDDGTTVGELKNIDLVLFVCVSCAQVVSDGNSFIHGSVV